MAAEKLFNTFLERNAHSASTYEPPWRMKDIIHLPTVVGRGIFILSCADSRADPTRVFNLRRGEASVIRNAGGRARDAFRTFEVMGTIAPPGLIIVLHHTDCGGLNTTDDEIKKILLERAPGSETRDWWGTFKDIGLEESVRQDVAEIRAWKFLPSVTKVVGFVFEVETGKVREVVSPDAEHGAANL